MTYFCSNSACKRRWENFRASPRGTARCRSCRHPATQLKRVAAGAASVYVIPDFPEHMNVSFGCVVKNRAHHRRLQKKFECHDWEPCRNSPGSQLSMGRTK